MTTPGDDANQNPYDFGASRPNPGTSSYQAPPSYPSPSSPSSSSSPKGFFGALFDVNFDNFISVKFAKLIYVIAMIMAGLAMFFFWVVPFFSSLLNGRPESVLILILGWIPVGLISLLGLISVRLFLEFVIATIKTSENTSRIATQSGS